MENFIRTPIKGLRVKLRNHLISNFNFKGKFSVEHHRRFGLLVKYKEEQILPILNSFEDFEVKFILEKLYIDI